MIRSFLRISLRNLGRHKIHTLINLVGLGTGIAASIFILLWISDELSFDNFHEKGDRVYSVLINNQQAAGRIDTYGATPAVLKDKLLDDIPEIEHAARYSFETEVLLKEGKDSYQEKGIYADPTFFEIVSFPIVSSNGNNPLNEKYAIAISQNLANRIFQEENPLGKSLTLPNGLEVLVSEVYENVPRNSSLQFDFVLPFDLLLDENPWMENWQSGGSRTMVLLQEGTKNPNKKLSSLIAENCEACTTEPFLFPFHKQRLYSEFEQGKSVGGKIQQIYLFAGVAFLILAMACINFMNLATAKSASRSKEVGVRKSIGASKQSLVLQFIFESLILASLASVFALLLIQLLLPFFNEVTGKNLELELGSPVLLGGIVGITLLTGLMSGFYPAWLISRFNPSKVLKGDSSAGLTGAGIRKVLVVGQFATSVVLIFGSLILFQQIRFISERNLGFDRDNVMVIDQNEGLMQSFPAIKNELQQLTGVSQVAFGGNNIFTVPITSSDPVWAGKSDQEQLNFKVFRCDEGFLPTLSIPLIAGRNFIGKRDSSNYLVNRKAVELMGLNLEEVVGTKLDMWNGPGEIVGVTEDFHNDNLKFGIQPLVFMYSEYVGNHYFIRLSENQAMQSTLDQVETIFQEYNPDYPFEFTFLNEVFDREYRQEQVIGKLSLAFTVLAVLISGLGLFGLSLFSAEQRAKEIGVRKVLGASVVDLVLMLFRDFGYLVGMGLMLGIPIAWWLADRFLSNYAFHSGVHWSIFILITGLMLLLTLVSVGLQSLRAALSNPVDSLHTDG
ncbi:ABC transporter permease [Algoriphagus lutimaris]|uniref:ABC transporter permease n=1 Tax=Algoriphagus lutimaris TaxID=613197 RepID=UPI00196B4A10|nr:ABC transporter permease [Algoriphagus lutimaris]MBN3519364.1 ABC transporter permease [Algoriphagus lutimaris]